MTQAPSAGAKADQPHIAAQFLTFMLADGVFAMDIATVREIIQHSQMTTVPLMPDFVRGVINLRGAVVPVIDLQARLGKAPGTVGKKTCIIIFDSRRDGERIELGLMVDSVSAVIEIPDNQIEPAPQFGSTVKRVFIKGMGKVNGKFVIILDPEKAMNIDEMAELVEHAQVASEE